MRIVGLCGSLRPGSFNRVLLETVGTALRGDSFDIVEWAALPLYAGQEENDAVHALKRSVSDADALLIATPEYNHSVPGAFKNAVDWVSRPAFRSPFFHKPVGIMSAAPGPVGGARAQAHLKDVLLGMGALVYPAHELAVGRVKEQFTDDGPLPDMQRRAERYAEQFRAWLERVGARGAHAGRTPAD